ncbi:Beclin 1-associated autophagy-related key regulator, partial [Araneus ventricosus]
MCLFQIFIPSYVSPAEDVVS